MTKKFLDEQGLQTLLSELRSSGVVYEATQADRATYDHRGRNIASTYALKSDLDSIGIITNEEIDAIFASV